MRLIGTLSAAELDASCQIYCGQLLSWEVSGASGQDISYVRTADEGCLTSCNAMADSSCQEPLSLLDYTAQVPNTCAAAYQVLGDLERLAACARAPKR
jgi:hypothetical protein